MKLYFDKTPDGLIPADAETQEWLDNQPNREMWEWPQPKKVRNPRFHRKFFALLGLVYDNLPEGKNRWGNREKFRHALTIDAGFFTPLFVRLKDGHHQWGVEKQADSIAWGKMKEDEFNQVFNGICDLICQHYLPGMDQSTLRAEIAEMAGAGPASEVGRMLDD